MTKQQIIANLKAQFPTIREGSDQQGYTELDSASYEDRINAWADSVIAKQAEAQAEAEAITKKAEAEAKLAALGLTADDLKALGLG